MEKEKSQASVWHPTKLLGHALVGGLFGLVCAVLPFSVGLSRTNVKLSPVPKLPPGAEDPVRLGIKALIWGSVYSVGGVGAFTFGVCWLLDVKSFRDFGKKMQTILPPKVEKIQRVVPKIKRRDHTASSANHDSEHLDSTSTPPNR